MTMRFGIEVGRPVYIGLANSLIAPATIMALLLGGWLADLFGYPLIFTVSAVAGLTMVIVLYFLDRDP